MPIFGEGSWPPTDVVELLGREHFSSNLMGVAERLKDEGIDAELAFETIQQVIFEVLQQSQSSTKHGFAHPLIDFKRFPSEKFWWGYLLVVCTNRCRRLRSQLSKPIPNDTQARKTIDKEGGIDYATALDELERLTKELTPKQRAVIVLLREGFSTKEISQALNVSVPRISQLKDAALRRLRKLMGYDDLANS